MANKPDNVAEYCRTIAVAGHRGDRDTVSRALTEREHRVRVVAIGAAARLGMLDPAQVVGFLSDPSPEVRYRALEVLPGLDGAASATEAVIAALDDPHLSEIAAFTLGEIDISSPGCSPETRAAVGLALERQATTHDDALCRESAVAALGSLGIGLGSILQACTDVATVRRRAVLALAPFEGEDVDAALQTALQDRDWQVRQAAEDLLGPAESD